MNMESYGAFVLFVMVMTGTPGAGNLSMMTIGQTTGFRSALPFLAGTTVGMVTLNFLVSLGLGGLFMASPKAAWAMKLIGMAYILYLGWKLLSMQIGTGTRKRFTFVEGVFLHPTNPKSWAMSVVGFSQLADPSVPLMVQVPVFVLTFLFFQVSCHSLWGLAGAAIMRTLKNGLVLTCVNCVLTAVMVGATAYAIFI